MQNTDVGLRRGLDSDVTSRKEQAGSILPGFVFVQLSSGHIDFFLVVTPRHQGTKNPGRQHKNSLLGEVF